MDCSRWQVGATLPPPSVVNIQRVALASFGLQVQR